MISLKLQGTEGLTKRRQFIPWLHFMKLSYEKATRSSIASIRVSGIYTQNLKSPS